jgi:hypothetical protein
MQSLIFASFWDGLAAGALRMGQDRFMAMLVSAEYEPDALLHSRLADVDAEVSGAGYVPGGLPIAVTVARDGAGVRFDFGAQVFRAATIKARGQVIYRAGQGGTPDVLVAVNDFGADVSSTADDFTVAGSSIKVG